MTRRHPNKSLTSNLNDVIHTFKLIWIALEINDFFSCFFSWCSCNQFTISFSLVFFSSNFRSFHSFFFCYYRIMIHLFFLFNQFPPRSRLFSIHSPVFMISSFSQCKVMLPHHPIYLFHWNIYNNIFLFHHSVFRCRFFLPFDSSTRYYDFSFRSLYNFIHISMKNILRFFPSSTLSLSLSLFACFLLFCVCVCFIRLVPCVSYASAF